MGRSTRRKMIKPSRAAATVTLVAVATVAFAASVSSSSPGFPGTIQPPPPPSNQKSKADEDSKSSNKGSSSSDDEAAGESSSDWDDALIMEEDPLAFVVDNVNIHSHSSDGDVDNDSENDGERILRNEGKTVVKPPESQEDSSNRSIAPPPPPPLKKADQEGEQSQQRNSSEESSFSPLQSSTNAEAQPSSGPKQQREDGRQSSDASTDSKETATKRNPPPPKPPPRNGHWNSKDPNRHPSNKKPLQTLEKLQQLLDDTDYLTSTDDLSHSQQQQQLPFQNPIQAPNSQQQQQKSSSKSSLRGINSLWTSKDRTKYKKQQRLQKEQIRLKQLQEEQLRKQQQEMTVSVETEEFSDTDDGLGYTLPNLPVYLSDGEEETDEALFLSEQVGSARVVTPESSASSSSASRSQQKQKQQKERKQASTLSQQQQYLQQQRDLFFAQQGQQQQQPPPGNPLHYPNQQQQPPPQQHPYYGAGPYPPPPPMGYYPYGPPPPQYYQYHPSYYPYRSLPRIDTTVPRNPRQISSVSTGDGNANPQEKSQQQQGEKDSLAGQDANSKSLEGERTGEESTPPQGGVVYPQAPFDASYYPQSPELQEQWHLQQLRILQTQEKYQRDLRRQHQMMVMMANLRSIAVSTWKTIGSVRKVSTCMALAALTCYASVSPRNLPYIEYNRKFYENLQTVALVILPPLIGYGWLLVDWNQLRMHLGGVSAALALPQTENSSNNNNQASNRSSALEESPDTTKQATKSGGGSMASAIHALIHSFYSSFVFGYLWVFVLEIAWTTVLRLGIFFFWEPDMFGIKFPWSSEPASAFVRPEVSPPLLILPWALREYKYKPKRITLLTADIVTSCIACPIIEEFAKLRLLQWTMSLSKNFSWVQKPSKHHKKQKMKTIAEPITDATDESGNGSLDGNVTNINPYIAGMLAVSLGLKWADAIRRVCMYTKVQDEQKSVYAFLRGIFPVQELCGIMTALGLARRDVLGQKMPLWKLLLPATIVHSMANLRGMKPIFKWNSSTPWAEMQLSPDLFPELFSPAALSAMEDAGVNTPLPPTTKLQWFGRAFPKIMWVIILGRAAGYCAKNYFMINRQAVRRATTYAGKHAAFSAELEAAQMLKKTKDEYNE